MKERIKRIPIIGYILRWISVILKLPRINVYLNQQLASQQEQIVSQQEQISNQQEQISNQQEQIASQQEQIVSHLHRIEDLENSIRYHLYSEDGLVGLNERLSTKPTIWGDKERLYISPLAAVFSCTLNTNSGTITVGDYTFAGSNVSILAGSHDMNLTGFLRREVEFTEGYNVVIGKGVWLGSNSTILGPCTIGDNAVIAAGAVVVPGTVIEEGAIYAGVPAKKIKDVSMVSDNAIENEHILSAIRRRKGILPVSGWSERSGIQVGHAVIQGYYNSGETSVVYTTESAVALFYKKDEIQVETLDIEIDDNKKVKYILNDCMGLIELNMPSQNAFHIIKISNTERRCFLRFFNMNDVEFMEVRKELQMIEKEDVYEKISLNLRSRMQKPDVLIMHETISQHDAVGNDIEAMYHILKEAYNVYVFAITKKNPRLAYVDEGRALDLISNPNNLILYHHSVNWQKGYQLLKQAKCQIIFRYHNITPANFFKNYSRPHYDICREGRELTDRLQREFPDACWIPASQFNTRDLTKIAADNTYVVPPFHKLEEWGKTTPDKQVLDELKNFSGANLLFVGRIVPNKGYLMLVEVLHQYCENYNNNVKLRIIGKAEEVMQPYVSEIHSLIKRYSLESKIEFIGEVTDETLAAYYTGSDVMLCCSAHEGFCVPIVEAQYFQLPIVALRYCAVPETLGYNESLVGYDIDEFACKLHDILSDEQYCRRIASLGAKNYQERFTYQKIREKFLEAFNSVVFSESKKDTESFGNENKLGRIAFVSPWFGEKIPGGAEMELRAVAQHLSQAGLSIEILTTQVEKFASDWNTNYYPEGTEYIWNIPVTRFPVRIRKTEAFDQINGKLMQGEELTNEEEKIFCKEMVNSVELYKYIRANRDTYDFFLFIPYMFGTTYYGIRECYDKAIMIPCLHDEAYAYMDEFKKEFSKVAGMIYNAEPEKELANRLYDLSETKQIVMGIGMDTDISFDANRFREKYEIAEPFLLYAGRKDAGKGVNELISDFCALKEEYSKPLKLVLIGGGEIDIPSKYKEDIIDLGFVDMQDKYDAYSAAVALCQLSKHESFSFVIMESWLCERPVIVHKDCNVTSYFVNEFQGGYVIDDEQSFKEAVRQLIDFPQDAIEMGKRGKDRVHTNFAWDVIVNKYIAYLKELKAEKRPVKVDVNAYMDAFRLEIEDSQNDADPIMLPTNRKVKKWLKEHFKGLYAIYKKL